MATSVATLKALGLNYSPNNLALPEGSMLIANNVVISRDNVVESIRGYRTYSQGIGTGNVSPKQLLEYKEKILQHYNSNIAYETDTVDDENRVEFLPFSGDSVDEAVDGLRIKYIEAIQNLYFTTSEGIKKISAASSDDFATTEIQAAGAVKAIDLTADNTLTQGVSSGFLVNDSAVAYRVVWGYKDANDNIILGAPSESASVFNFLSDVIILDFNTLNLRMDSVKTDTLFSATNFFDSYNLVASADASDMKTNVVAFAENLDNSLELGDDTGSTSAPLKLQITDIVVSGGICTVTVDNTGGNPDASDMLQANDYIEITGLTSANQEPLSNNENNPYWIVLTADATTFTFACPDVTAFTSEAIDSTVSLKSYNYRYIINSIDTAFDADTSLVDLNIGAFDTHADYNVIHVTIQRILQQLKSELPDIIDATNMALYLTDFNLTFATDATVTITIPDGIDSNYFFQIYRTRLATAEGSQSLGYTGFIPVTPGAEYRLVYEEFPSVLSGSITVLDQYPDDLAQTQLNLYTNPVNGEGELQANDVPPFATDINTYKNYTFFANTKTKQRIIPFTLFGLDGIAGPNSDKITISSEGFDSITYQFTEGVKQVMSCSFDETDPGNLKTAIDGKYIRVYTPYKQYRFWFNYDGTSTAPTATDDMDIPVYVLTGDDNLDVASKFTNTINSISFEFTAVVASELVTITNTEEGIVDLDFSPITNVTDIDQNDVAVTLVTAGDGEDASATPYPKVLLSQDVLQSQRIDQTARSLVRVINQQANSPVVAYYISGTQTSPGILNLESKTLNAPVFYVLGSSDDIGSNFTPNISPEKEVSGAPAFSVTGGVITFNDATHTINNGDEFMVSGSDSTPIIDGIYTAFNVVPGVSFDAVTSEVGTFTGTYYAYSEISDVTVSNNEDKPNRVYYSKKNKPDAVPLLNYVDVGSANKEILRIFPLRDSLFVFKEDGLFRISGENAPFVVSRFDSSCVLVAPDSVAVSNNIIYGWTLRGISNITESGVRDITRPIDVEILKISGNIKEHFVRNTWGVGYDSDNSYIVFTSLSEEDEYATIGFRYSDLTNTWTNIIKDTNCGLVRSNYDKLYMGAGGSNTILLERKNFDRTDYAHDDFNVSIPYFNIQNDGNKLKLTSVTNIEEGDVIAQEQYLTISKFNQFLAKLDFDPTIGLMPYASGSLSSTTLTIDTGVSHFLSDGDYVTFTDSDIDDVDGLYEISNVTSTTFDVTVSPTVLVVPSILTIKRNYEAMFTLEVAEDVKQKMLDLAAYLDTDLVLVSNNYETSIAAKSGNITSNSVDDPTEITATSHGLLATRIINISGTQATQSVPSINGRWEVESIIDPNTFTIDVNVITAGTTGLVFATDESNFLDIRNCFNIIMEKLNNDAGSTFGNYTLVGDDEQLLEAVILNVDTSSKVITLNLSLQFMGGVFTVYKKIENEIQYAPITMGDPLTLKQIFQVTAMFDNKAFTNARMEFSTDLKPEFLGVDFNGDGNGIFGHYSSPGFGYGTFGGLSNSAPFRTIPPRQTQRCRYMNVRFLHDIARENWALNGITLSGNMLGSIRGYR